MTPAGILALAAAAALTAPGGHGHDARPTPGGDTSARTTPGPAFAHSIAQVNDSRSHGALGDNLLSLNEAIGLYNRTITVAQLSLAEVNQLSGFGADIAWAAIDASAVPVITVEQDFDLITDLPHGLLIEGFNGEVVIDFGNSNVQHGFRAICNYCNWRNLILQNGRYYIDLVQTDASFGGTVIDNVVFDSPSQYAISYTGSTQGGYGRLLLGDCEFRNAPVALQVDESMQGRLTTLALFDSKFDGCNVAVDCLLGPGGSATYQLQHLDIRGGGTGLRILRAPGADRAMNLQAQQLTIAAADGIEYQGEPGASSQLVLRMLDLQAAGPGEVLRLGPQGGFVAGALQDSRLAGDVVIETGGAAAPFEIENGRFAGGNVTVATAAGQPLRVRESRFDACAVATAGQGAIDFTGDCFVGGSLQGTPQAQALVNGSHVAATVGGDVVVTGSLAVEQLGSFALLAPAPALGGQIALQADLPPGLAGLFLLGVTADPVFEYSPRLRAYLDLTNTFAFPGVYRLQQSLTVPVPSSLTLLETDWVVQFAVLPDAGVPAPWLQAPPGYRFVLR